MWRPRGSICNFCICQGVTDKLPPPSPPIYMADPMGQGDSHSDWALLIYSCVTFGALSFYCLAKSLPNSLASTACLARNPSLRIPQKSQLRLATFGPRRSVSECPLRPAAKAACPGRPNIPGLRSVPFGLLRRRGPQRSKHGSPSAHEATSGILFIFIFIFMILQK